MAAAGVGARPETRDRVFRILCEVGDHQAVFAQYGLSDAKDFPFILHGKKLGSDPCLLRGSG